MTDVETNEAVARKLGEPIYIRHGIVTETITPEMAGWQVAKMNGWFPDYCHDIAAAWKVVEKLHSQKFKTLLAYRSTVWEFYFTLAPQMELATGVNAGWGALADAAPMAICRAYLKLPNPV